VKAAWVSVDGGRGREFVAYGCDDSLTSEPISDADILPIQLAPDSKESSEAWSCDCQWYFKATEYGIVLARPGEKNGMICLKRSWRFVEAFLDAPRKDTRKKPTAGNGGATTPEDQE